MTQTFPQTFAEHVLPALLDWRRADGAGALVTLVRKTASGPRPLGSQLAVSRDGHMVGLISGGCVEGGIAAEAGAAMAAGANRRVRFGAGSRYVDLRLPCGGAIDVYVDVTVGTDTLAAVDATVRARRPTVLVTDTARDESWTEAPRPGDDATFATAELAWRDDTVIRRLYRPQPRLVLAGRGPIVALCATMAALNGYAVQVLTDDPHAAALAAPQAAEPVRGLEPGAVRAVALDPATAVVTLFHDHDVELPLLRHALASPAFHIGALGSRTSQAARLALLQDEGLPPAALARIEGPAGVPIHAANPAEIATSIVAGVIRAYRTRRPSVEHAAAGPARADAV